MDVSEYRRMLLCRILLYSPSVVLCLLLMMLTGCGKKGPEFVPVKGTITFGGGTWPKPGCLYFTVESPASDMTSRPGTGEFDTKGNITATTLNRGDGLMPGRYKIAVVCWEVPPSLASSAPSKSYVPLRYRSASTSGLEVTVEPGQRVVELNLDIPKI